MAAMSAAMLTTLAAVNSAMIANSSGRGSTAPRLAARPRPVTEPMRALTIWMATMNGVVRNMVQHSV
jgi:hypothetical protein